jgi:hypothetical protein
MAGQWQEDVGPTGMDINADYLEVSRLVEKKWR